MIPIDTTTGLQAGQQPHGGRPDACYGLVCPQRSTCALYASLGVADGAVIESCQQGRDWPLYRAVKR